MSVARRTAANVCVQAALVATSVGSPAAHASPIDATRPAGEAVYRQAIRQLLHQPRFQVSEILHYGVLFHPERDHLRLQFVAPDRLRQDWSGSTTVQVSNVASDAVVTPRGIEGDRVWALIDRATGRVVSAKQPRKWHRMLTLAARHTGTDDGSVTVLFPDGREISSHDAGLDEALSAFLGRPVHLSTVVPDEATIARLDPIAGGELVLEMRDRTETTNVLGGGAPKGTFFDYAPLHPSTSSPR